MDLIFFIVLGIVIAYVFILYKVENMTNTPSASDQIKQAVKEVYLADVEAIRNLSEVATKLQADGLTIPGSLDVKGNTIINGALDVKGNGGITTVGDLHFPGTKNQWIIHTPDDDRRSLWIAPGTKDKEYGNWNWGRSLNIDYDGNVNIGGNQTVNGEIKTPNGHTFRCAGRQHMVGEELLYILHKNGVVIGKEWGGNGNLSVQGNLSVGGNLSIGGRSNLVSVYSNKIAISCDTCNTVTHNRNYPNPANLAIQVTAERNNSGDNFSVVLCRGTITANSFQVNLVRLNAGCGSDRGAMLHYTIFEYY